MAQEDASEPDPPTVETPPSKTDFGAPIIAGPFDEMLDARNFAEANDAAAGIYWEGGTWFVHGHHDHESDGPELTTYGEAHDAD